MKTILRLILFLIITTIANAQTRPLVFLLNIQSAITPAVQNYVQQGITAAKNQNATLIILQLNTPGGLDKSMRGIISDILASPIPIVSFVAPSGARAASAGTFILYASHIAAMAPGTNLGAATPIKLLPDADNKKSTSAIETKTLEDAKAYIRSLAQLRQRNSEWAEQAVNSGASLSADEALKLNVINLIATDVPNLLAQINGNKVTLQDETKILETADVQIKEFSPSWRTKFLMVITDPNVAYILLMIGIWGLFFEFVNPGFVLPGVAGAIALLLALYAFQLLPINYVGLSLIILGIIFLVAEAFIASFGTLGIGGIIALVLGSFLLLDKGTLGFQIAYPVILAACVLTAIFFLTVINLALKSRFKPVVSGREELIGKEGNVIIDEKGYARIRILGELWEVWAEKPLVTGQKVKVIAVEGLTLKVEPI